MTNLNITKLDWDSEFWGLDIYNVNKNNESIDNEPDLKKRLKGVPFVIQALALDSDLEYINTLEVEGFRFVESKVSLVKKVEEKVAISPSKIFQEVREEDLLIYRDEFYSLYGQVSRFNIFSKEKVNEFYYMWTRKSIQGNMDDNCIGYYEEKELEGFITYKITNQKLIIGLIGVFSKYQGKKISQHLLAYINNIAVENDCKEIYVATQGKNTKAINAYIKSGFLIDSIKQWYYYKGGVK